MTSRFCRTWAKNIWQALNIRPEPAGTNKHFLRESHWWTGWLPAHQNPTFSDFTRILALPRPAQYHLHINHDLYRVSSHSIMLSYQCRKSNNYRLFTQPNYSLPNHPTTGTRRYKIFPFILIRMCFILSKSTQRTFYKSKNNPKVGLEYDMSQHIALFGHHLPNSASRSCSTL